MSLYYVSYVLSLDLRQEQLTGYNRSHLSVLSRELGTIIPMGIIDCSWVHLFLACIMLLKCMHLFLNLV